MIESWLTELVHYYRGFGFFGEFRDLSVPDLVETLLTLEEEAGGAYEPDDFTADLRVLRWDELRVWTEDQQVLITPETQIYEATLQEWAEISRGSFSPEQVRERWDAPEGPVWVEMLVEGFPYALEALHHPHLLDLEILKEINQLLLHPFYRFELCEGSDRIVSVLTLTPEERVQIERERGLVFHVHDLAHLFEAASLFLLDQPEVRAGHFVGTLKDCLERAVGKLSFDLTRQAASGLYQVACQDFDWALTFEGEADEQGEDSYLGSVRGRVHGQPFEGVWKAGLSNGDRFLYGTWVGQDQAGRQFNGTFGGLEESTFESCEDAYIVAMREWLKEVWEAPELTSAPLTLLGK